MFANPVPVFTCHWYPEINPSPTTVNEAVPAPVSQSETLDGCETIPVSPTFNTAEDDVAAVHEPIPEITQWYKYPLLVTGTPVSVNV